jgi:dTDP-glucose 4,6-dehydratase
MRLLVTGAAGFIGSNFLEHILNQSSSNLTEVRVIDALTYSGTEANFVGLDRSAFQFIKGDIRDENIVDRATTGVDAIIHFAAESHVDRSIDSSRIFVETNVVGTENLLSSAVRNDVKTFVHVSTDEVYGSISEGSWTEDFPLSPNSPYAASKASSDLIALAFHKTHELDVRVTRCSNNYGPRQYPEKVIPLFVTNILEGKKVPLYGQGRNVRDWLHVSDHCRAIELVLQKGRPGQIYNIGGGRELSNSELTRIILQKMSVDESRIDHVPDRKGHDFRYSLNWSKISVECGYFPLVKFELGLSDTIKWYQANETWWKQMKTKVSKHDR